MKAGTRKKSSRKNNSRKKSFRKKISRKKISRNIYKKGGMHQQMWPSTFYNSVADFIKSIKLQNINKTTLLNKPGQWFIKIYNEQIQTPINKYILIKSRVYPSDQDPIFLVIFIPKSQEIRVFQIEQKYSICVVNFTIIDLTQKILQITDHWKKSFKRNRADLINTIITGYNDPIYIPYDSDVHHSH